MKGGHRAIFDAAPKAISHHQFCAVPKLFDEAWNVAEVIAIVGIAHDNEPAACSGNSTHQSAAIASFTDGNDPRPEIFGDFNGSIGAAVVGNDDFTRDTSLRNRCLRLANAFTE